MIRITSEEHIKKSGDFKLDGLWVTEFHLQYPKTKGAKQKLTITLTPFTRADDGSPIFDHDVTIKVYLDHGEQYLMDNIGGSFFNAYFATEQAISDLVNEQLAQYGWTTQFEMPS